MASVVLIVLNWDKYNPRKDVKNPSWFRFEHGFFNHWQFYDFNAFDIRAWLYILCEASVRNEGGKVTVNLEHAHRVARIAEDELFTAIEKLKEKQVIECRTLRGRYVAGTHACTTRRDETRRNGTERDETNVTNEKKDSAQGSPSPDATEFSDPPENLFGPEQNLVTLPAKTSVDPDGPTPTALVWRSYKAAYEKRHGKAPPWNAKIAGQIKQFVGRMPAADAPFVAEFYLSHNDAFYVKKMHQVGPMLSDAEKLHVEWSTGRKMTSTQAKSAESMDHYASQMERVRRGEL